MIWSNKSMSWFELNLIKDKIPVLGLDIVERRSSLRASIRIVTSGSSLAAAQNKMQSYFDRPNDTSDKLRLDLFTESKSLSGRC